MGCGFHSVNSIILKILSQTSTLPESEVFETS